MDGTTATRRTLRDLARNTAYVFTEAPLAFAKFCILLPMAVLGLGLSVLVFGIPVLILTMVIAEGFARLDRVRIAAIHSRPVPRPTYRHGRPWTIRQFNEVLRMLADPLRIREWLHAIISLPLALASFTIASSWVTFAIAGTTAPLYQWMIPDENVAIVYVTPFGSLVEGVLTMAIGLAFLVTLPPVMRGLAAVHVGLARTMLAPSRLDMLQSRVTELSESRDAAVSVESDSLRRLERDIHDGPQQRLVRLAMDLSTVQRRLDTDPDSARPLVDEALQQTRETLDELRALSRGIAPPILVDRGLHAALSALAARSTVRTEVDLDLPEGARLHRTVETAAYFVCAEALANAAKHSQATRCTIAISRSTGALDADSGTLVHVIVTDDGIGGAHAAKGHGLAGLTDRVRAIDGSLHVESPTGGPTVVSAELPCGS